MPVTGPVFRLFGGDGMPIPIVDEEFNVATFVDFESPRVVSFCDDGVVSPVFSEGANMSGDGEGVILVIDIDFRSVGDGEVAAGEASRFVEHACDIDVELARVVQCDWLFFGSTFRSYL